MSLAHIRTAVAIAKSQGALSRAIGVSQGFVSQWCSGKRPVPPDHCPAIELATGVRCEGLRPDLHWERDDAGTVTSYRVRLAPLPATASAMAA